MADELIGAIKTLNEEVKKLGGVLTQNIMQRQDGRGRYPGYSTTYFGTSKNYEEAKWRNDEAKALYKNSSSLGNSLLGMGDVNYKINQIKNFQHEVDIASKKIKDLEKEEKNLSKSLKEQVKDLKDISSNYKEIVEDAKELDDKELASKYGLTTEQVEKIRTYMADINELEKKKTSLLDANTEKLKAQTNVIEAGKDAIHRGFDEIKRNGQSIIRIGKQFADSWAKVDTASANFARNVGMGGKGMGLLRTNTIKAITKGRFAEDYGLGMEDLLKLRSGYASSVGRNVGMSKFDLENAGALSVVMGEKGNQLAASLENFGLSYSEAANRAAKMYKTAGKYGLSFEKYSENFLQNIKMAQNYTFKNGLRGLDSMAKKATAMKIDMQQMASFADKVGTLQGAVETSAQLQVLGGPFAQFANPLQMLGESMYDMEGLMDRFHKMVGSLGRFDAKSGEVNVSAFDKQRLRAAAQAMGMNYDQVMEHVNASGRREYINNQIAGRKDITDEDKEFIRNSASVSGGTAFISYFDKEGKSVTKNVKDMTKDELNVARAQNQTDKDNIRDIAKDTRTLAQQLTGYEKKKEAVQANAFDKVQKPVAKMVEKITSQLGWIIGILTAGQLLGNGVGILRGGRQMLAGGKALVGRGGTISNAARATKIGFRGGGGKLKAVKASKAIATGTKGATAATTATAATGIKGASNILKFAKAGAVFGGIVDGIVTGIDEFGTGKKKGKDYGKTAKGKNKNWKKYGRTAGGALGSIGGAIGAGALAGSVVPGLGNVAGAIVGLVAGTVGAIAGGAVGKNVGGGFANQKRRERKKGEFGLEGLKGDYSVRELKSIAEGKTNEKLDEKLRANGDLDIVNKVKEQRINAENATMDVNNATFNVSNVAAPKMTKGGIFGGDSEYGDKLMAFVNSGEMILNKGQQSTLFKMIDSGFKGVMKPRQMLNDGMLKVMPSLMMSTLQKQKADTLSKPSEPFNLNMNGTIKLDAGNGVTTDILGDLVKNPVFVRQITKLIEKQMITNDKGGNVVSKGLY